MMKKIWSASWMLFIASAGFTQQTEGRVVYERTTELRINVTGGPPELQQMVPRNRVDKLEVLFGNNQSLRKPVPKEETNDEVLESTGNGGRQLNFMAITVGADDVTYSDLASRRMVEQREFASKRYLIEDTLSKLTWKITAETKTILGYTCQQAIAQRMGTRMQSAMVNGEIKTERVADTSAITAWFTTAIPVAAGPELPGQLPGLILALDINNGRIVYKALEVTAKVNVADIKEPKGGKKMTQKEFAAEREKMMQDMQKNMRGGRATIRIGG